MRGVLLRTFDLATYANQPPLGIFNFCHYGMLARSKSCLSSRVTVLNSPPGHQGAAFLLLPKGHNGPWFGVALNVHRVLLRLTSFLNDFTLCAHLVHNGFKPILLMLSAFL